MTSEPLPSAERLAEADQKIVEVLREDGRISIRALAKIVDLPETTTRDRLHRLEREGMIQGYQAIVDPKAMGFPVMAWLVVDAPEDRLSDVGNRLERDPNSLACYTLLDRPGGFAVRVAAASTERLTHTVQTWRKDLGITVKDLFLLNDLDPESVPLDQLEYERNVLGVLKRSF